MRKLLVPAFFAVFLFAGHWLAVESWDGNVFVYLGERRAPAATRSIKDYSAFSRQALFVPVPDQMMSPSQVWLKEGSVGLKLGHPLLKNDSGGGEFACALRGSPGVFNKVELTFTGTGISSSGDQPQMVVEVDCVPSEKLTELNTIWIPMQEIAKRPAQDQDFQLFGEQPLHVRLINIPGEWPTGWVLSNVRMYDESAPTFSLTVDSARMRESGKKLLSFDYQF